MHAPDSTWNLGSELRSPDTWTQHDALTAGSIVAVLFPVKAANGEGVVPQCYHGQLLSLVNLKLRSDDGEEDDLRLAFIKWLKPAKDSEKPAQKEQSAYLVDAMTGLPGPPAQSAKWTAHMSARTLADKYYDTDEWIPLNRVLYRAALLPYPGPSGAKVKHVLRV